MYFVLTKYKPRRAFFPLFWYYIDFSANLWSVQVHRVRICEMRFLNMSQSFSELRYKDTFIFR